MTHRLLGLLAAIPALWLAPAALARDPVSINATVSAADPRAAQAGRAILRQGGSATDAAIAMMLALNVVEPHNSGIGGGGFLMHHDGQTGVLESIDGRETAPAAARPDRFIGPDGQPLSFRDAWPGGYSAGVPGNVRLAWDAHRKWGKLPWAALFQRIAAQGPDAFYLGENARAISDAVTNAPRNPVPMTLADLAAYQAKPRKPVCGTYRVHTVCGMGPASSGGITVLQILGMVERFPLGAWGKDDVRSWHVIGEAMRLAYADRETWLGDPDFVTVPIAGLIDPAYLNRRSRLIALDKAMARHDPGTPPGAQPRTPAAPRPESGTSHFVAIDRNGDIAAWTSTIESFFGSQLIANGVILNNELTDFSFTPQKDGAPVANRVEPGKRPLSSMSPTIVYDDKGTPVFTVGAAGGKTIIMQVVKAIIAHFDWGLSAQDSIAMGLIFFNKDGLVLEAGTHLEPMKAPLEKIGHGVTVSRMGLKANAAERGADGRWTGAADPRSPGVSLQE